MVEVRPCQPGGKVVGKIHYELGAEAARKKCAMTGEGCDWGVGRNTLSLGGENEGREML